MNLLSDHIKEFIQPYPRLRYTKGEYELRVLPREELDMDEEKKFWRMFRKFPNEFAAAAVSMLPKDVEFKQYDHLNNTLFLSKK
ncbi:MAG: hypothetical protein VXZ13_13780 [Pseudomonadota bacterium]|nr:hypothetical protein [Pseudomonadota bacterium]|tara:strand:+ start:132 stop:383 length:252 start_codon:yes stop_codon:yes gene_type:complete